eukprot:1826573-Amphidinium_carterae.1
MHCADTCNAKVNNGSLVGTQTLVVRTDGNSEQVHSGWLFTQGPRFGRQTGGRPSFALTWHVVNMPSQSFAALHSGSCMQ